MGRAIEIPYGYGDVISITGSGQRVIFWVKDSTGLVRGLLVDITDPANPLLARDEIVIRRKTDGQLRKKKLPPVGQPLPAAVFSNPVPAAPRPSSANPAQRPAPPRT